MSPWQPIETAPAGVRLLVWGNGDVRFAIKDDLGGWRARWGGAFKHAPKVWMPVPEPPHQIEKRERQLAAAE